VSDVSPRPLLVTDDEDLLDDLLRLITAAGLEPEAAIDPAGARAAWSVAPLILVGGSVAAACVRARLPRRAGVMLVSRGRAPASMPVIGVAEHLARGMPAVAVPPFVLDGEFTLGHEFGDVPGGIAGLWRLACELGVEHVAFLPAAERWLIDRLVDSASEPGREGRVIGVVGGRGGAGASVLAAGLAVTASRLGRRSMLIDADPLGGGLDLVVGRESAVGLRWPDLAATVGRISATALFHRLPRVGDVCVLSWDRGNVLSVPPAAVDAAIDAGRRGTDLIVLDLPRWPDEGAVHALQAAETVFIVVPAEVRAGAAASRVATLFAPHCGRLRCVVRGPAPAGLRSRDLADAVGLPLAGVLRTEPRLAAALERGEAPAARGRGPLADVCRRLLGDLELLPVAA
jgi:secretion/DNA translocation related CpaE-like protein